MPGGDSACGGSNTNRKCSRDDAYALSGRGTKESPILLDDDDDKAEDVRVEAEVDGVRGRKEKTREDEMSLEPSQTCSITGYGDGFRGAKKRTPLNETSVEKTAPVPSVDIENVENMSLSTEHVWDVEVDLENMLTSPEQLRRVLTLAMNLDPGQSIGWDYIQTHGNCTVQGLLDPTQRTEILIARKVTIATQATAAKRYGTALRKQVRRQVAKLDHKKQEQMSKKSCIDTQLLELREQVGQLIEDRKLVAKKEEDINAAKETLNKLYNLTKEGIEQAKVIVDLIEKHDIPKGNK